MINRTMVRTRVVQSLFAYYKVEGKTPRTAEKELLNSFASTYSLYMTLLDLANEVVRYAELQLEENQSKARITHQTYVANRRLVDGEWAKQLFENRTLRNYMANEKLGWDAGMGAIRSVYKQMVSMPEYKAFMQKENPSYEEEKQLWRKIYTNAVVENKDVIEALEEMEVALDQTNWVVDMDVVLSYVVKTIKLFKKENGEDQPLLEMFDSEEELKFGTELLKEALSHKEEYDQLVESHLTNWDAERLAYMDKIILQAALTEILHFQEIALEVSMNEYLELAKEYSSDKSHQFINGMLDSILKEKRQENKLLKPIR